MKNVLIILFIILSTTVFAQKSILFDNFKLGDKYQDVLKSIDLNDTNSDFEYDGKVEIAKFVYVVETKKSNIKLVLTFINDYLYSVRYYPCQYDIKCTENIDKYIKMLNKKYITKFTNQEWYNDDDIIYYEVDNNNEESFVHYDKNLLKKYPDYL